MNSKEIGKVKKIAILIRNFTDSGGGAERYCVETTIRLAKIYEVSLFTQNYDKKLENITHYKIPIFLKKPRFLNQLFFSIFTYFKTRKKGFDIIHSHDLVTFANVYTLHVPTIKSSLTSLNLLQQLSKFISPRILSYLYLERKLMSLNKSKRLISVSKNLTKNITSQYPHVENNIDIVSPGIDQEILALKTQQENVDNFFKILFVGHGFRRKGLQVIIDAVSKIPNIAINILVAGRGKSTDVDFSSLTENKKITFLGEITEMRDLYHKSDLLVHPTLGDTFGMAVLEAMSAKLPVIVSSEEYCGISGELTKDQAIFIKNPRDSEELKDILQSTLQDRNLMKSISNNGFKFAKNKTWDKSVEDIVQTYNKIIK